MNPLYHRDPNLITSALINPRLDCEMISDGYHLQLPVIKLLTLVKGERSYSVRFGQRGRFWFAYPDGTILNDGCIIRGGAVVRPNGVIAGSTCDLSDALKTLVLKLEIPLPQAVKMLSLNLARKLKLKEWGILEPGYSAVWSVYTPQLKLVKTIIDERYSLIS